MYSIGLINAHFWLATIGTVLYIASMWVNGIAQGLMWRAVNEDGTLTYSFVETLVASHPGSSCGWSAVRSSSAACS
jgi:cytochrome c oxidase cbb3-type subunit 1